MRKSDGNRWKGAVVLLITAIMVLSPLTAVMANTMDEQEPAHTIPEPTTAVDQERATLRSDDVTEPEKRPAPMMRTPVDRIKSMVKEGTFGGDSFDLLLYEDFNYDQEDWPSDSDGVPSTGAPSGWEIWQNSDELGYYGYPTWWVPCDGSRWGAGSTWCYNYGTSPDERSAVVGFDAPEDYDGGPMDQSEWLMVHLDLSDYENTYMTFRMMHLGANIQSDNQHAYIRVSTDYTDPTTDPNLATWTILKDYDHEDNPGIDEYYENVYTVDLSIVDHEGNVWVAFNRECWEPWNDYISNWGIDEVYIYGEYVPPGGCDFKVVINEPVGVVNSLPHYVNVTVANLGPVPIVEVKKLLSIYEMVPGATTEVFTDDFEGDLSNWTTTDNGDGDTFTISSTRAHSGTYSYRCTAGIDRPDAEQDTYLGHAADSGPDELILASDVDLSGAAYGTISFWHWCQGEYYVNEDGAAVPTDYGTIAVSNDSGATWVEIPQADFVAYDNGWEQVTICLNHGGCSDIRVDIGLTAHMAIKFMWDSDPHMEYEGWYIDDVTFTRTEEPTWKLIDQGWSKQGLDGFEVRDEEFPLPWESMEEGKTYKICVEGQVFDPAGCESNFDNNEDCELVTIINEDDVGVTDITGPERIEKCTNGTYTATVENFGTFPESNIPVDLKVSRLQEDTLFFDDFEGGSNWLAYYFVGDYIPDWFFHITTWDAYSGGHALACFDESAAGYPNLLDKMGQLALIAGEGNDPAVFDFNSPNTRYGRMSFYAKWSFSTAGDSWAIAISDPDQPYVFFSFDSTFGYAYTNFQNEWSGPRDPNGFPEYYDVDLLSIMDQIRAYYSDECGNPIFFVDENGNPDYSCNIGFAVFTNDDGCVFNSDNPEPWSGLLVDDVRVYQGYCGQQQEVVDTVTVPYLDVGGTTTVEFEWHGDKYCDWCVCAETALPGDENPANDAACMRTRVTTTEDDMPTDEAGEAPWDHVDHTDVGGTLWHVVSKQHNPRLGGEPPTDQYFWNGDDDLGVYLPNTDDSLISEVFSLAGAEKAVVKFDTYYDFASGDRGEVWYSDDAGQHWYKLGTISGFKHWGVVGYIIPGEHCTDQMQIKFRMVSDGYEQANGWYIDDISVSPLSYAGQIMQESFGDAFIPFPPTGWTENVYSGDGHWEQTTNRPSSFTIYGGVPFWAVADSDAHYGVTYDVGLMTPSFSVAGTTLTLEFDTYFSTLGAVATVRIYSGGSYVDDLAVYSSYTSGHKTLTYPVGSIPDPSDVQIEFYYQDFGGWDWYWAIDNINIYDDSFAPILSEDFGVPLPPPSGFPPGWISIQYTTETNYGYPCYWDVFGVYPLPSYAHTGTYSAGLWWGNQPQDEWLISPEFDWSDGSIGILSLWSDNFGHYSIPGYYWEGDYVKFTSHWTGDVETTSWQTLGNLYDLAPDYTGALIWHDHTFALGTGDAVRFAFHRYANWGDDGSLYGSLGIWHVDDVTLDKWSPGPAVFEEDVEDVTGPLGTWTASTTAAGDWWHLSDNRAHTGLVSWWCGDEATDTYPTSGPGLNNSLYAEFDLTATPEGWPYYSADLEFYTWGDFGPDAYGYVEISDDGGLTWSNMWEFPHDYYSWDWTKISINLDQFVPGNIIVRFRFTAPGEDAPTAEGWYIDDIVIHWKHEIYEDTTPPITSICIDGTQVTLYAYDPLNPPEPVSGVCHTYYILNGGAETEYTGPFTIGEGTTTIEYWSVDCAGNEETHKTKTYVIDTTAPTVTITAPESGALYIFGNKIMNRLFGNVTLCIGKIMIEAEASDTGGSGIAMVTFDIDNDTGYDTTAPYQYLYNKKAFGLRTVTVTAYDNAGNTASATTEFKIYCLGLL